MAVGMEVPRITTFCWCMGLEDGSKVIGFVHLLTALASMVVGLMFGGRAVRHPQAWHALLFLSLVHVPLALTLLRSVYKRHGVGLRVWCCCMCVFACVGLAAAVGAGVVEAGEGMEAGVGLDAHLVYLAVLAVLLFYSLLLYCVVCVNSFYLMLKSFQEMELWDRTEYQLAGTC